MPKSPALLTVVLVGLAVVAVGAYKLGQRPAFTYPVASPSTLLIDKCLAEHRWPSLYPDGSYSSCLQ